MNSKGRPHRSWMPTLSRLVFVLSFLMMMASTAVSLSNSNNNSPRRLASIIPGGQAQTQRGHDIRFGPAEPQRQAATQPQHAVKGMPGLQPFALERSEAVQGPVDLKLLVISADGQETDFPAIKTFLNQLGIPYKTLIASQTQLVPSLLWDGVSHGYYQGVLLCTGNLGTQQGVSAFDASEWEALWQYEAAFGIRQATLYTYPSGYPDNYGLQLEGQLDTSVTPLQTQLTPAGEQVFFYLSATTPITIEDSYTYLATVISPTVTTPFLVTPEGYAIASVTQYPDGRQNLAVTAANSSDLMHSMLLSYGIVNWVTNGLFLGERHVNLDAQLDDMLLEDEIWDTANLTDTTGLVYRMTGNDLNAITAWQADRQAATPFASPLRLEWAFNGEGGSIDYYPGDTLTPAVLTLQNQFNWVNHAYSHANLDAISYSQATAELSQNHTVATNQLSLTRYFRDAMVQPDVSGLNNPEFLRAAADFGIRYLIADTSQPGWNNPSPNVGFYSAFQPNLLIIPRRPSNLFYNVSTPAEWVSEYNYFYGPTGIWPYWDHNLSYSEILDKESEVWLDYLLRWDIDPLMFHQSNTRAYSGTQSLLGDLIDATFAKYNRHYNLPVRNLSEHEVGINMANRMAYNASGARASILACSLTLTATNPAVVPVTGIAYGANREVYGGQNISYIQLNANQTVSLPAPPPCQIITFGPLANKMYDAPPFAITATASSNLTVTFAAVGPCLVSESTFDQMTSLATVTIVGDGLCTITAGQSGDANYKPAASVSQTFAIVRPRSFLPLVSRSSATSP